MDRLMRMGKLISVNVGLPREIQWRGHTVYTGIWKDPVSGRCCARRLNLDGDGQGDLAGHGGEHRAVFVYQIESYRFWEQQLRRTDFVYGQFGENFTIEGLADDTVCIGDRFRIGSALFEVTQPRVTCYRVGIRMNEPNMPALLTSSRRPGFYFRVIEEGEVGSGDEIVKVAQGQERMTVAETNALLYSAEHPRDRLESALRMEALPLGWRKSFEALLKNNASIGNAGLVPQQAANPSAPGFHRLLVEQIHPESADVLSLTLKGESLPAARPGQYVVVRLSRSAQDPPLFRSYSISGPSANGRYRISVKIEPHGMAGAYLSKQVREGDVLEVSAPRGSFVLDTAERPLVLLSAGIGATPVLAMLHSLAAARSMRDILWLHAARDGDHHPFAAEVRCLLKSLARGRNYVCFSRPGARDQSGRDYDFAGHISRSVFAGLNVAPDSDVYLCGPNEFMNDMREMLVETGIRPEQVRVEIFNGGESLTPGISDGSKRSPHPPVTETSTGVLVSFARSGIAAHWNSAAYRSILELAEACDVPARWSCRAGVCHNCETGLVSGTSVYSPEPLVPPAQGNILTCCSQPASDMVIDL